MSTESTPENAPGFEVLLSDLETVVNQLEDGSLDLEASLKAFETGMALAKNAGERLDQAEARVTVLTADDEGGLTEVPFDGA